MKRLLLLLLALLLLTGCGDSSTQKQEKTIYAMDTVMTLTVYGKNGETALMDGTKEIRRLDMLLSATLESSEIYRINRDRSATVSRETGLLIQRALEIAEMTDGAFDPTVYPLMKAWGFASENGENNYRVPENVESLLSLVDYRKLHLQELTTGENAGEFQATFPATEPMGLDLGGIAKGYTSQKVLETIRSAGVDTAVISLGGNVGVMGTKPDGTSWTVAIRNPDGEENDYLATLSLSGQEQPQYVITSGGYERYFEQDGVCYHHILDPGTGYPADTGLLSVTVVSSDGTLADALSTALFVMGGDKAQNFWRQHSGEFDMILYDGTTLYVTPGVTLDTHYPVTEVTP